MRKQVLLIISGNLLHPYLTNERHQILALIVAHRIRQKGKVNAIWQIRKPPPMTLSLQTLASLLRYNFYCHNYMIVTVLRCTGFVNVEPVFFRTIRPMPLPETRPL